MKQKRITQRITSISHTTLNVMQNSLYTYDTMNMNQIWTMDIFQHN